MHLSEYKPRSLRKLENKLSLRSHSFVLRLISNVHCTVAPAIVSAVIEAPMSFDVLDHVSSALKSPQDALISWVPFVSQFEIENSS